MPKSRRPLAADPFSEAAAQWQRFGLGAGPGLPVSLSLVRAQMIVREANTATLAPFGLTPARHEVLMLLYFSHSGELPLGKIGVRLIVHPSSVTNAVDGLAELELVLRLEDPNDRRTRLARITPKGRRVARQSSQRLSENGFGLGVYTDEELEALDRLLWKLRASAGDFVTSDGPD
jgi:DNA-binding MarR family transcriptional regulator